MREKEYGNDDDVSYILILKPHLDNNNNNNNNNNKTFGKCSLFLTKNFFQPHNLKICISPGS